MAGKDKDYKRSTVARELLSKGKEPKEVIEIMKKDKREPDPKQVAPTVYKIYQREFAEGSTKKEAKKKPAKEKDSVKKKASKPAPKKEKKEAEPKEKKATAKKPVDDDLEDF